MPEPQSSHKSSLEIIWSGMKSFANREAGAVDKWRQLPINCTGDRKSKRFGLSSLWMFTGKQKRTFLFWRQKTYISTKKSKNGMDSCMSHLTVETSWAHSCQPEALPKCRYRNRGKVLLPVAHTFRNLEEEPCSTSLNPRFLSCFSLCHHFGLAVAKSDLNSHAAVQAPSSRHTTMARSILALCKPQHWAGLERGLKDPPQRKKHSPKADTIFPA